MLEIVILAAGKGTRMRSSTPKVLQTLAGKPFVQHVIDTATELSADKFHLVIGHGAEMVEETMSGQNIDFVMQEQQLGTGHAVQQALPLLSNNSIVLILYGDVPLLKTSTLSKLLEQVSKTSMGLLTVEMDNPFGYGRIVRCNGGVSAIVEQKDASAEQLDIKEVNTGVMALRSEHLKKWLPNLSNNNSQGEYYLTDIIEMAAKDDIQVLAVHPQDEFEVMGVNNRQQQAQLERVYQNRLAESLMSQGVMFLDPARFDCRGNLTVGTDVVIDVNCLFEGEVELGNNVTIGPNCVLRNCKVGDNTHIHANCVLEDSEMAEGCQIGPFARMRPGSKLADGAKLGNFVETKKSFIGKGSKVNHLSYVGDSDVGERVNIGAGVITCNYDGANKHKTTIGDNVFLGSNSSLVAPVNLAEGTTVAAGATVTKSSGKDQLVVARTRQRNIDGWVRPVKKK